MKLKAILFCILIIGCTNKSNNASVSFNKFLASEFELSIPDQNHIYILIPSFSCLTCVQISLEKLNEILKPIDKPNISIIYQNIDYDFDVFTDKALLYYDKNNGIEYLSFAVANVTIIRTSNNKIFDIINTNPENIYKIFNDKLMRSIRDS